MLCSSLNNKTHLIGFKKWQLLFHQCAAVWWSGRTPHLLHLPCCCCFKERPFIMALWQHWWAKCTHQLPQPCECLGFRPSLRSLLVHPSNWSENYNASRRVISSRRMESPARLTKSKRTKDDGLYAFICVRVCVRAGVRQRKGGFNRVTLSWEAG